MEEALRRRVVWKETEVQTFLHFSQYIYTGDYRVIKAVSNSKDAGLGALVQRNAVEQPLVALQDTQDNILVVEEDNYGVQPTSRCKRCRTLYKPQPQPEASPGPWKNETREKLWVEIKGSCPEPSLAPELHQTETEEIEGANQLALLAHAKVYVFADYHGISKLQQLALHKLRVSLVQFNMDDTHAVETIAALAAYGYENTRSSDAGEIDDLRRLILLFTAYHLKTAWKRNELKDLVMDMGGFGKDIISTLMEWT